MKKSIVILLLFFSFYSLFAQNNGKEEYTFTTTEDKIKDLNKQAVNLPFEQGAKMLNLASQARSLAEAENLRELEAKSLAIMGIAYYHLQEIDQSLNLLNRSYDIALSYQYSDLRVFTVFNMGIVYRYLNDFDKALTFFDEALSLTNDQNPLEKISIMKEQAETYKLTKQYDRASSLIEKALSLAEIQEDRRSDLELKLLAGDISYQKGDPRAAVKQLIAIVNETDEDTHNGDIRASAMSLMGRSYAQLKDFTRALSYGQDALLLSVQQGLDKRSLDAYESLSLIYREMQNYKEAYHYLTIYYEQKDRFEQKRNETSLNSIKAYYGAVEKDRELKAQKDSIQKQKRIIIALVTSLVLISASLALLYWLNRKYRREAIKNRDQK